MASTEDVFVYVELDENLNTDSSKTIHILGVDKENPIIQMDKNFFVGKYDLPLGTYMFFEDDPSPQSADILFDKLPKHNLKYICKTQKLLKMERTYVTPKEGKESEMKHNIQHTDKNVEILNFKTIQEAIEKFRSEWNDKDIIDKKESNSMGM